MLISFITSDDNTLSDKQLHLDAFFTEEGIKFFDSNCNHNCPSYLPEINSIREFVYHLPQEFSNDSRLTNLEK